MEYTFNLYNSLAPGGCVIALKKIMPCLQKTPVIVCVGSDLSIGDSLGPIAGTMIKNKLQGLNCYIYGTLARPITAKEVKYMNSFITKTHPQSPVIAIDAAVGKAEDVGIIKVTAKSIRPGSGANKKLSLIGDTSIIGVVAEKTLFNYSLISATRLNIVYRMANIIAEGVSTYIYDYLQNNVMDIII